MVALAQANLTATERAALEAAVEALVEGLGDDLVSVWLYGSRARGEGGTEDSDVDLLVITRDRERDRERVSDLIGDAADAAGADQYAFMSQVFDPALIAERRAIGSFFLQEVDRDKLVLYGDAHGARGERIEPPDLIEGEMKPRTAEFMELARERLPIARMTSKAEGASVSVGVSYYASLYAARAALSERDLHAKTHSGTWTLFRREFVQSGEFDAKLTKAAANGLRKLRESADYAAAAITPEQAKEALAIAERFVAAVEELLDGEADGQVEDR
jgi:uncharacterized protein (UPF0332 family)/predicted nucleotidyltransferase